MLMMVMMMMMMMIYTYICMYMSLSMSMYIYIYTCMLCVYIYTQSLFWTRPIEFFEEVEEGIGQCLGFGGARGTGLWSCMQYLLLSFPVAHHRFLALRCCSLHSHKRVCARNRLSHHSYSCEESEHVPLDGIQLYPCPLLFALISMSGIFL